MGVIGFPNSAVTCTVGSCVVSSAGGSPGFEGEPTEHMVLVVEI